MGAIKATELSNGNIGLEITYGGKEAPFGGVDTSAPPAYIDPKCFTQCDGFIVVNNKLVTASLNPITIPPLWNNVAGVTLIGFGNFYNQTYGTLNYALGYAAVAVPAVSPNPSGVTYTFYMTSWAPGSSTTAYNDVLTTTQYNSVTPAVAASITMQLQSTGSGTPGSGATVIIETVGDYVGYAPDGNDGVHLTGIITSLSISGGSGYVQGTTYYILQNGVISAQVTLGVVSNTGAIIDGNFTLATDTFTTTDINSSGALIIVATAGINYTASSSANATLTLTTTGEIKLAVDGPWGGPVEYDVPYYGLQATTPSSSGSWACVAAAQVCSSTGHITSVDNIFSAATTVNCAIVTVRIPQNFISWGGSGYNVGEMYYLVSGHVIMTAPYLEYDIINNVDPGVYILVTSVSAGGAITGFYLMGSGGFTSAVYQNSLGGVDQLLLLGGRVPVNSTSSSINYILTTLASEINGTADAPYNIADVNVTAVADTASSSLILTARLAGVLGNQVIVLDTSVISGPDPIYYYFPVRTPPGTYLAGGNDGTSAGTTLQTVLPAQASIVSVGGTLYIGNIGPFIIKYEKPGVFVVSSTYLGVQVLRKFAGSLIGLGYINAPGGNPPGTFVSSQSMVFAWSATNDLDIWNPEDLNGNITGAGFEQLADIGDYLTGLVVTSGTAFILRSQGISYATATGNATSPFSIAHIGLGDQGEGSQLSQLVCQYDQTGVFVGNTDIFQVSNAIVPIGSKIKYDLYQTILNSLRLPLGSTTCAVYIEDEIPVFIFAIGPYLFIYNASNGTWQNLTTLMQFDANTNALLGVLASSNTSLVAGVYDQTQFAVMYNISGRYVAYILGNSLQSVVSLNANSPGTSVTFPVEEIAFGRDITIDGIYVSIMANISENTYVYFSLNQEIWATYLLSANLIDTEDTTPYEFQVFPDSGIPYTGHSPQLRISLGVGSSYDAVELAVVKVVMFGSYDPNQRPV
jgi:hypothetical protein